MTIEGGLSFWSRINVEDNIFYTPFSSLFLSRSSTDEDGRFFSEKPRFARFESVSKMQNENVTVAT